MDKRTLLATLAIMMVATLISAVKAQIDVTITLTDSNSNSISGPVHINTIVYVHGYYADLGGSTPANAVMEAYYNNGTTAEAILYTSEVNSGQTITETYNLTKDGSYEFRWTCTQPASTTGFEVQCITRRGFVSVSILTFPAPEPGTIAGLIMALSAFGLLAIKKAKH